MLISWGLAQKMVEVFEWMCMLGDNYRCQRSNSTNDSRDPSGKVH